MLAWLRRSRRSRVVDRRLRLLVLAVFTFLAAGLARAQHLVVFVDGRLLHVRSAALAGESRLRLDLKDGGSIEVPLSRIDRVIEDEVEAEPAPIEAPRCQETFAAQPLPEGTPFERQIVKASRRANLHPWLVAAVVDAESRFDPGAVSPVGARGLMQLMPAVWIERGLRDPHNSAANLDAGAHYLRQLLDRYKDLTLALAAYNAGPATVDKVGGVPPYRETRQFIRRVLASFCPPVAAAQ